MTSDNEKAAEEWAIRKHVGGEYVEVNREWYLMDKRIQDLKEAYIAGQRSRDAEVKQLTYERECCIEDRYNLDFALNEQKKGARVDGEQVHMSFKAYKKLQAENERLRAKLERAISLAMEESNLATPREEIEKLIDEEAGRA